MCVCVYIMPEILSRIAQTIAQTTGALANLKMIWKDKHCSQHKDQTAALLDHVHIPLRLWDMETDSRNKDPDYGDEKLQKTPWYLIQRTHYERGGSKQNPASHWTLQRTLDHCETTQAAVVWAHYKIFGPCQDISPGYCARWEKGQTEKTMGR